MPKFTIPFHKPFVDRLQFRAGFVSERLVKESNGPTYVEDDNGNKVDVGILKNVTGIVQHPVINFEEDAKKNVIELIPQNSTETLRKGGGTQTDIDQTKNDNFEKFSNIWINKVTADEYAAANAYSHYMNNGNVAFIKKGASKDERKKAVLALGVDEDKWEENQKYLQWPLNLKLFQRLARLPLI